MPLPGNCNVIYAVPSSYKVFSVALCRKCFPTPGPVDLEQIFAYLLKLQHLVITHLNTFATRHFAVTPLGPGLFSCMSQCMCESYLKKLYLKQCKRCLCVNTRIFCTELMM